MATVVASELFLPPPLVGRLIFDEVTFTAGGDAADEVDFDFF